MSYLDSSVDGIEFDLGPKKGGLIVYADETQRGKSFDVWWKTPLRKGRLSASVVKRRINGVEEFAAVFPSVPTGTHRVSGGKPYKSDRVTIFANQVAEVDYRSEADSSW